MQQEIRELCGTFVSVWQTADQRDVGWRTYAPPEQAENGERLRQFVDVALEEATRARGRDAARRDVPQRLLSAFTRFACDTLEWNRPQLDGLLAEFPRALDAFRVLARRFDPALSVTDLYQAARNAVTMHCLQRLLGVPVGPTPAILAYSLLYPYTDNYLDDPGVGPSAKALFVRRLGDRLAGDSLQATSPLERQVFRLVALIEGQFARDRHPQVYRALLAIHSAQLRSVRLLHHPSADEMVEISIEKGGTSVLADGYLVAGMLSAAQAECLFGLGVFLQLRDDLEDVVQDGRQQQATPFSALPPRSVLDGPTARTLGVGRAVLDRLDAFPHPAAAAVRELMARSLLLTITDAAASIAGRYSRRYLAHLEAHSPFRFSFLREQRRRVSRAQGSFTGALEAWLAQEDTVWGENADPCCPRQEIDSLRLPA